MPRKEVRDPIHGLIKLEPEEWGLVDTLPFQRLRGIQQLAMTHLVYPGARHSRWEHCVGAAHLAGKVAKSVDFDPKRTKQVRMAALAHDIGHGPFSHVSEEIFEKRTERKQVHEAVSSAITRHHPEVRASIGDETAEWVADLLGKKGHGAHRSVERDIVAGPADVDKLDYLLRDSHFCGVKYGEYDLEKVVESTREVSQSLGVDTYLGFNVAGLYALEEMLLARYHMHRQVYGHKTRVATDRMLVRAMELGINEGLLPADVFTPPDEPELDYIEDYVCWDDSTIIRTLIDASESKAGDVMRALVERRLFKRVVEYNFQELVDEFGQPAAGYVAEPEDSVIRANIDEAEEIVAKEIGVDRHWVCLHWVHTASPIGERFSFKVEGSEILIVDGDKARKFNEVSEVFSDTELRAQIRISLYALLPDGRSPSELDADERGRIESATKEALMVIGRAAAAA